MDTFTVLEKNGNPVGERPERKIQIRKVLIEYIKDNKAFVTSVNLKTTRKIKSFSQHVVTEIINSPGKPYSTLEVNCPDQPGILAVLGKILAENKINLQDARITTLGERVEDLFYITDENSKAIQDDEQINKLKTDIKTQLEQRVA